MGAMMALLMTFVITLVNIGWQTDFTRVWTKAYALAYVIAVPVIHFRRHWPASWRYDSSRCRSMGRRSAF